jgi:hypothetical protein
MSVFDDRTTIGLIRFVASKCVATLSSLLEAPNLPPLSFQGDLMRAGVAQLLDTVLGVE